MLILLAVAASLAVDSTTYVVTNHGRPAGEMIVRTSGDSTTVRFWYVDRNRGPRSETVYRIDRQGRVLSGESRALGADFRPGIVTQRFEVSGDSIRWSEGGATRAAKLAPGAFFGNLGTPFDGALLARHLLAQPNRAASLVPAGSAKAQVAAEATASLAGLSVHLRMVAVDGTGFSPVMHWLDDSNALFASQAGWFITVRKGGERALPVLRAAELKYRAQRSAALAARLAPKAAGALVIRNGNLFDSEQGIVKTGMTVVIQGDRIREVGPAASVATPSGATVIDATGKTVLPGL